MLPLFTTNQTFSKNAFLKFVFVVCLLAFNLLTQHAYADDCTGVDTQESELLIASESTESSTQRLALELEYIVQTRAISLAEAKVFHYEQKKQQQFRDRALACLNDAVESSDTDALTKALVMLENIDVDKYRPTLLSDLINAKQHDWLIVALKMDLPCKWGTRTGQSGLKAAIDNKDIRYFSTFLELGCETLRTENMSRSLATNQHKAILNSSYPERLLLLNPELISSKTKEQALLNAFYNNDYQLAEQWLASGATLPFADRNNASVAIALDQRVPAAVQAQQTMIAQLEPGQIEHHMEYVLDIAEKGDTEYLNLILNHLIDDSRLDQLLMFFLANIIKLNNKETRLVIFQRFLGDNSTIESQIRDRALGHHAIDALRQAINDVDVELVRFILDIGAMQDRSTYKYETKNNLVQIAMDEYNSTERTATEKKQLKEITLMLNDHLRYPLKAGLLLQLIDATHRYKAMRQGFYNH